MISLDDLKTNADSTYAKKTDLSSYATQTWVNNKGYLISSSLSNYYTKDQVDSAISNASSSSSGADPILQVVASLNSHCPYCGNQSLWHVLDATDSGAITIRNPTAASRTKGYLVCYTQCYGLCIAQSSPHFNYS